jgi:hypothetical protein
VLLQGYIAFLLSGLFPFCNFLNFTVIKFSYNITRFDYNKKAVFILFSKNHA